MSNQYDAIVIGAGHNGLVCANYLAKSGRKVLVLEASPQVGGMAGNREFAPGFSVSGCAHLLYGLHPSVYKDCELENAGLEYAADNILTMVINQNREYAGYSSSPESELLYGSASSQKDADDWSSFMGRMNKFSEVLHGLAGQIPPRLKNGSLDDYKTLLSAGLGLRRLDRQEMRQFLRIIGMNIYDLVEENFSSDLLKAGICHEAVLGSRLGPRAPNTVYNWLNRRSSVNHQAGISVPKGGMGSLCQALADTALDRGVDIAVSSRVQKVLVSEYRACGVETVTGEAYSASTIISNADIKTTMLDLVGGQYLDTDVVRRITHVPMQGSTAKIHIALDRLPQSITGNEEEFRSRIIYAPNTDYVERASNAIKYGEYSGQPEFELTVPSTLDASLAPGGGHVMSVLVPFVPYTHKNGWEQEKAGFENHVMEHIEHLFPGTRAAARQVETLTPEDIEDQFNVTGGHWHHGETGLERFLMLRPIPGFAQYRTSVDGLYLCGADCHPGGDVTGAPGMNAAQAVMKGRAA